MNWALVIWGSCYQVYLNVVDTEGGSPFLCSFYAFSVDLCLHFVSVNVVVEMLFRGELYASQREISHVERFWARAPKDHGHRLRLQPGLSLDFAHVGCSLTTRIGLYPALHQSTWTPGTHSRAAIPGHVWLYPEESHSNTQRLVFLVARKANMIHSQLCYSMGPERVQTPIVHLEFATVLSTARSRFHRDDSLALRRSLLQGR